MWNNSWAINQSIFLLLLPLLLLLLLLQVTIW